MKKSLTVLALALAMAMPTQATADCTDDDCTKPNEPQPYVTRKVREGKDGGDRGQDPGGASRNASDGGKDDGGSDERAAARKEAEDKAAKAEAEERDRNREWINQLPSASSRIEEVQKLLPSKSRPPQMKLPTRKKGKIEAGELR